jgi:hypothetical protein
MPNPRDTGGNVRVDRVWGNFPKQPNDDRLENGGEELDYALNDHVIVEEGRYGFPSYTPGNVGDGDDIANTTVPAITGVLEATALTRLTAAGLDGVALATTTEGATEANEGKVASQDPAAGTAANVGDEVEYSLFELAPAEPDLTFTAEVVGGDGLSFASSPEASVLDVEIGDVIVASGFDVLDETYTANPSGNFDVNGEWTVDRVSSVGAAPDIITIFSSSALRTETTGFDSMYAAAFGSGTIEVFKA